MNRPSQTDLGWGSFRWTAVDPITRIGTIRLAPFFSARKPAPWIGPPPTPTPGVPTP